MDEISNVVRQQAQVSTNEAHVGVVQGARHAPKMDVVEEMQKAATDTSINVDSKEEVEELVAQLNKAMSPISTSLKFGVDLDDIFYVSVIESETSKMIRRFPVEQAASFLPKMQEFTGVLFDSKG
ncbi:MAG: flagellar protein FlaG [Campylobacterota bacterium]|nr:flagellar protein FlaG [Campylobacterota bacterium]